MNSLPSLANGAQRCSPQGRRHLRPDGQASRCLLRLRRPRPLPKAFPACSSVVFDQLVQIRKLFLGATLVRLAGGFRRRNSTDSIACLQEACPVIPFLEGMASFSKQRTEFHLVLLESDTNTSDPWEL